MSDSLPRGDEEAPRSPVVPRGSGAAMIKQAEKTYAPREVERQVQEFWKRAKVYSKTVAAREKDEDFYFGDGPPFTSGTIHLGNVLTRRSRISWSATNGCADITSGTSPATTCTASRSKSRSRRPSASRTRRRSRSSGLRSS